MQSGLTLDWKGMSAGRYLRMLGIPALFAGCASVLGFSHPGFAAAAFGDISVLALLVAATVVMFWNAAWQPRSRQFWLLFGVGCLLWSINQVFFFFNDAASTGNYPLSLLGAERVCW